METIQVEITGPVAWVWLNRPRRLNALNGEMLAELQRAFEELGDNREVGAVVLAGRGPAFSGSFSPWLLAA